MVLVIPCSTCSLAPAEQTRDLASENSITSLVVRHFRWLSSEVVLKGLICSSRTQGEANLSLNGLPHAKPASARPQLHLEIYRLIKPFMRGHDLRRTCH